MRTALLLPLVFAALAAGCAPTILQARVVSSGAHATAPSVAAPIQLEVDVGTHGPGAVIGQAAGSDVTLATDLGELIENDVQGAWGQAVSLTGKSGTPVLRVVVTGVSAGWPMGFSITVETAVSVRTELLTARGGDIVFTKTFSGAASGEFTGGGTVGNDYLPLLQQAYTQCIDKLVRDGALTLAMSEVRGAPVIAQGAPAEGPATSSKASEIVAVFDVEDTTKSVPAASLEQLSAYVTTSVSAVIGYRVVPHDQLRKRLAEEKAQSYRACVDESCQIELGKALAAQKSLAVKLLAVGNQCVLTASLFDLRTETTEKAARQRTDCGTDALIDGVDKLLAQLR